MFSLMLLMALNRKGELDHGDGAVPVGFFDQFGSDGSDDEVSDNGEPLWWADACETSEEDVKSARDDTSTSSSEDDMPDLIPRHMIPRHLLPDDSSSSDDSESTSDSMPGLMARKPGVDESSSSSEDDEMLEGHEQGETSESSDDDGPPELGPRDDSSSSFDDDDVPPLIQEVLKREHSKAAAAAAKPSTSAPRALLLRSSTWPETLSILCCIQKGGI